MKIILNSPKYGKKIILIDKDDFFKIKNLKLRLSSRRNGKKFYVKARCNKNKTDKYLHEIISGYKYVDHINMDTFDNRKKNLRKSSPLTNSYNKNKHIDKKTSKYKGVFKSESNKWYVQIAFNGKRLCLGTYDNEEFAAKIYNKAAIKYHKKFAKLNSLRK